MYIAKKSWELLIPAPIEEVWDFFSKPSNLKKMTPPAAGFRMLSPCDGETLYPGMLIDHVVSPIPGIPLYWVTEIVQVDPLKSFTDRQLRGPFDIWQHRHEFHLSGQGTLIRDILHYRVGWGVLGTMANTFFVEKQIEGIFSFREEAAKRLFG